MRVVAEPEGDQEVLPRRDGILGRDQLGRDRAFPHRAGRGGQAQRQEPVRQAQGRQEKKQLEQTGELHPG